jgi:DNA-binding MarR family transcriptional regulator
MTAMKGEVKVLQDNFLEVYDKFKLEFFRRIFELVREREGSLTAMEAFSIEVIHALGEPTIGRFAEFLNISQSNATYKVNSLIKKGYLKKLNSDTDRREYHLVLSEKYYNYTDIMRSYVNTVVDRIEAHFSPEETAVFSSMLGGISRELMPEADKFGQVK